MAYELPNYGNLPRPSQKPTRPDGIIQLAVTPEKACTRELDVSRTREKKKVCFVEELEDSPAHQESKQHQYQCLGEPQMNSTYGITKQLEKLKSKTFQKGRALKDLNITEQTLLDSVGEKTSAAVNFKRSQKTFSDLVAVDIDAEKELEKAAPRRTSYESARHSLEDESDSDDIMSFWTPDLVTETAKLDYDKNIDSSMFDPEVCNVSSEYLTDYYLCKEIASQFR